MWFERWRPYVPVAQRVANGQKHAANLAKKEKRTLAPVKLAGRKIASTFWGKAWCDNLEAYSDYSNRLPRGRSYIRNGSVIDLQIERGKIKALVSGSSVYTVTIDIATLPKAIWQQVKNDSAQSIDSMLDLLAGRFDDGVMTRLTRREDGLFPKPKEIKLNCSCPDWATMCKHCAAVLYGVGSRLDSAPELLFLLRGVDHTELIGQAVSAENLDRSLGGKTDSAIPTGDLGEMFGIDLVGASTVQTVVEAPSKRSSKVAKPKGRKATVKVAAAKVKLKATAGGKKTPRIRPKG
jgi:uncharacterized Zn finger protein